MRGVIWVRSGVFARAGVKGRGVGGSGGREAGAEACERSQLTHLESGYTEVADGEVEGELDEGLGVVLQVLMGRERDGGERRGRGVVRQA